LRRPVGKREWIARTFARGHAFSRWSDSLQPVFVWAFTLVARDLLWRIVMRTRYVLAAVVIGLALTPVVLSIGALVLIPLAIVMLPVLLLAAIAAIPAVLLSSARASEPGPVAVGERGAHAQISATAS
jgi:hypothetical protein